MLIYIMALLFLLILPQQPVFPRFPLTRLWSTHLDAPSVEWSGWSPTSSLLPRDSIILLLLPQEHRSSNLHSSGWTFAGISCHLWVYNPNNHNGLWDSTDVVNRVDEFRRRRQQMFLIISTSRTLPPKTASQGFNLIFHFRQRKTCLKGVIGI